ncbi:MAG: hypothetical protein AABY00_04005 [Nanoarchaeota archaeon]
MKILLSYLRRFIADNFLLCIVFFGATFFFLFQHALSLSWDFSSYVLNAQCYFYDGMYCETQRPPLASFLLAPFLLFGVFGEYLYIFGVSLLFLYATVQTADVFFEKRRVSLSDKEFFRFILYFCSLSSFTLLMGLKEGTELLTLSLLELSFVQILRGKNAGFYMGLAFLARYPSLVFVPFLLFNSKLKGILKNFGSFLLIIFPWFLWNFVVYGNWFTSFIDGYAQNIALRQMMIAFSWADIFIVANFFLIPALIGILIVFKESVCKPFWKNNREFLLIALVAFIIIWNYVTIPTKFPRYLFNLILPLAFFSSITGIFVSHYLKKYKREITFILFLLFLVTLVFTTIKIVQDTRYNLPFEQAAEDIQKLRLSNCEILSPHWVPVTYYTENVYPLGYHAVEQAVMSNKTVLIFHGDRTPDDSFSEDDLKRLPVFYSTEEYTFFAKESVKEICAPKYKYNEPYVQDHCALLASKFSFLKNLVKMVCLKINRIP